MNKRKTIYESGMKLPKKKQTTSRRMVGDRNPLFYFNASSLWD